MFIFVNAFAQVCFSEPHLEEDEDEGEIHMYRSIPIHIFIYLFFIHFINVSIERILSQTHDEKERKN